MSTPSSTIRSAPLWCAGVLAIVLAGCTQDMADQPRYEPLERPERQPVPGTVARGELRIDDHFYRGKSEEGKLAATLPMPLDENLLARGRERYNIFCANCHDRLGDGQGMVVRRGFTRPPSLHIERLQNAPVGHFFDVATNGFGRMPSLAPQIPPKDRWAIAAFVKALQLSQHAERDSLSPDDLEKLDSPTERNDGS